MSATFVCEARSSGNTAVTICWFKVALNSSTQIAIDSTDSRLFTIQQQNKKVLSTFTLNNVSVSDATTYLCNAKTDTETITSSANLTIVTSMSPHSISATTSIELISTTTLIGLFDSESFNTVITLEATSTFVAVSSTQSNSYSRAYADSSILSSTPSIKDTQTVSSTHTPGSSLVPTSTVHSLISDTQNIRPTITQSSTSSAVEIPNVSASQVISTDVLTMSTQGFELPSAQPSISPTLTVHSLISDTQDIRTTITQSSTSSAVEIPNVSASQTMIYSQSLSTDVLTTSTRISTQTSQLSNALISSVFSTPLLTKSTQSIATMAMSQSFSLVSPTSTPLMMQPVLTSNGKYSITTIPTLYTTLSSTHLFSSGMPATTTHITQEHSITTNVPTSTITVVPGTVSSTIAYQ